MLQAGSKHKKIKGQQWNALKMLLAGDGW